MQSTASFKQQLMIDGTLMVNGVTTDMFMVFYTSHAGRRGYQTLYYYQKQFIQIMAQCEPPCEVWGQCVCIVFIVPHLWQGVLGKPHLDKLVASIGDKVLGAIPCGDLRKKNTYVRLFLKPKRVNIFPQHPKRSKNNVPFVWHKPLFNPLTNRDCSKNKLKEVWMLHRYVCSPYSWYLLRLCVTKFRLTLG